MIIKINNFLSINLDFINNFINSYILKSDFSFLLLITIIAIAGIMILFTKYYFDQKGTMMK